MIELHYDYIVAVDTYQNKYTRMFLMALLTWSPDEIAAKGEEMNVRLQ
jgi:hypothetical protein